MSPDPSPLEREAKQKTPRLPVELLRFVLNHKKWWLIPVFVVFLALAALVLLGSSGVAPFIYSLF